MHDVVVGWGQFGAGLRLQHGVLHLPTDAAVPLGQRLTEGLVKALSTNSKYFLKKDMRGPKLSIKTLFQSQHCVGCGKSTHFFSRLHSTPPLDEANYNPPSGE